MHTPFLLAVFYLATLTHAQGGYYILQDSFHGGPTFFDNFNFWTSWDPTYGFVHYVDQETATQFNMINITNSTTAWGVDTTQVLNPDANLGRLSIRLTSVQTYTHGLFVLDLAHMPTAVCGSWPSFWSLGGSGTWPASGEIDIIEVVNQDNENLMSLHTMPGCSIAGADETGTLLASDCGLDGGFAGCTVEATTPSNFGSSFNDIGGGVYVMDWTSVAIQIWFFPRDSIPSTLSTPFPDVSTFGEPMANFEGSCNIDTYFFNHSLIFDVDFCGSWAGPTFQVDGCPALDPVNSWTSCNEFVALNPGAFTETYWEVNYLNVYQLVPGTAPTSTSSLSSLTPAISTSSGVTTALSGAQGRSTTPTMSIAGTTPSITTGTFTATSSVLSVLSSLSASSASASLAGSTAASTASSTSLGSSSTLSSSTATSFVSPTPSTTSSSAPSPSASASFAPTSPLSNSMATSLAPPTASTIATSTPAPSSPPATTASTSAAPITSTLPSTAPPAISSLAPLQAPPSTTAPPTTQPSVVCNGYLCTSYTTAVVVETVYVNILIAAENPQDALLSPPTAFPPDVYPLPSAGPALTDTRHPNGASSTSHSNGFASTWATLVALTVWMIALE